MDGHDFASSRARADLASSKEPEDPMDLTHQLVGVGMATQEAVPAAFAIASVSPHEANPTWDLISPAGALLDIRRES